MSVHTAYAEELTDFATMAQDIKDILTFASSEWPGVPWPYSHANVFVGGGDEEFPMLANDDSTFGVEGATVRFVAAHELLHNYFPFYMGIDERRYPAMDEGWTTAFEYLFNLEDLGQEAADALFIKLRSGNLILPYIGEAIPMIMPADATRGFATGRDSLEKAMKILKQKMSKEGILQEVKRRRFYEKPSVKKKRKMREARKRRRREMKRRGSGGQGQGQGEKAQE